MRNRILLAAGSALIAGSLASETLAQSPSGLIGQDGSDNAATIMQADATGSEVSIDQIGEGHSATVSDSGTDSLLELDQSGRAQTATIRLSGQGSGGTLNQDGGNGDIVEIESGGGINTFTILQTSTTLGSLTGNQLGLIQSGDLNTAVQTQQGFDNTMSLEQNGSSNLADMLQDGTGNTMSLVQTGVGNEMNWTQDGANLPDLSISQSNGTQLTITQQGGG